MPKSRHPQLAGMLPLVSEHPHVTTVVRRDLEPRHVQDAYEAGDAVVFSRLDLGLTDDEWEFVNRIKPPGVGLENLVKKAKMKHLKAPIGDGHVLCKLGLNPLEAQRMQDIIFRVNAKLIGYASQFFPEYKFTNKDDGITWRFTVTESEEMHYDAYGKDLIEHHHVRLFVNMDDKPRLWGVGPPVTSTLRGYRERLRPFKDMHPNLLNDQVNRTLPWEEVPRHYVMFMPGNAWLVNSQLVAHEIIYGRKMVACTFDVDPTTMRDPSKCFNARVRAAAAAL